jgi:FtsP/CotA-like multicopper oxidase with cupredoxin domain
MRRLICASLLLAWGGLASAQSASIPVCNGSNGPICTDYFGSGNWANSPLPAGPVASMTLIAGGSGYANPVVVITDAAGLGSGATGTATLTGDVVTALTIAPGSGGQGYVIPQVTIVDVGLGGTPGAVTCGNPGQAACGSGAMATAVIGPDASGNFAGGMPKFQTADTLPSYTGLPILAGGLTKAVPDTTTFPGSDYYEIALVQYSQKLHSSLPPTTLRGYTQLPTGSTTCPSAPVASYLGPVILAQKNRAVRVKFMNCLPAGTAGNLFIPVDSTYMGAGAGPGGTYTENRATLHLHGGASPWISDGTPHQWTVPASDAATLPLALQKGDSVGYVPDMYFVGGAVVPQCGGTVVASCSGGTAAQLPPGATNDPGPGSLTFYWTNQQGGRLMFYHDHTYGLTRLNVYAGEAAGYLLVDPTEEDGLANATAPGTVGTTPDLAHLIPLVIQDKTFVPSRDQVAFQDPTWVGNFGATPLVPMSTNPSGNGDLWFPHVYMPNQNPADPLNSNGFGRWDYGPWFHPPQSTLTAAKPKPTDVTVACTSSVLGALGPTPACPTCGCPITPNPSGTPEGFMDTPVVNGVAYPVLHVEPAAYRFQILAAGNDRSWNLSWFKADATGKEVAMLPANPPMAGSSLPLCSAINPLAVPSLDLGLATALLDPSGNPLNGTGLPSGCWPNYGAQLGIPPAQSMWAADGRAGGAPDPTKAGPPWIQIGSEGGLLPAPVVIPATPVNYEQNTRSVTIGNVAVHGLWLGPAERADVIVDFSGLAGQTLILYNDAPAPAPAIDSRVDYFTGDGDQSPIGGAPGTQPGYGPNTRTIMQVIVDNVPPTNIRFNLNALKAAFATTPATATTPAVPGLFATTQPAPVVPETAYNSAYGATYPNTYATAQANNLTFTPVAPVTLNPPVGIAPSCTNPAAPAQCGELARKAIQELFTLDYGRMNATLGTELPLTNFLNQTTIPLGYVDPPTEIIREGDTQLWRITHNGVDTHFIHFHLFNVQVVNRVGWDGTIRPPDANEVGWKDTVRMNPLEDILVALQPITPSLPWPLPNSVRLHDVTAGIGTSAQFTNVGPFTNLPITTLNAPANLGWEYVWHCHILGHEENDMMRPIVFQVRPPAPSDLVAADDGATPGLVHLAWTDNSASETGFIVQRDTSTAFSSPTTLPEVKPSSPTNLAGEGTSWGGTITTTDTPPVGGPYFYRVQAKDDGWRAGLTAETYNATPPLLSAWSLFATPGLLVPTVTFTGAPANAVYGTSFTVSASTIAGVMPTITGNAVCGVGPVTGTPANGSATVTLLSGIGTCTLTATWPATASYQTVTSTQTTTAAKAVPAVTFTGAPQNAAYNTGFTVTATTSSPSFTSTPTIAGTSGICTVGAVGGNAASATAPVTLVSGTGACTVTASWAADTNYQAAIRTQTTTAGKLGSTTTITSSPLTPAVAGQPVTVSVSVVSAVALTGGAAGPTGTVTVAGNGSNCVATLTGGTGSCALSFATTGTKTLTATYAPDANFNGSTSAGVSVQIRDFGIALSPVTQNVNGGQSAKYTVTVTSLNGLTGPVSLGCSGSYPSAWACAVSPQTLNLTSNGTATANVTVTTVKGSPGTYNVTLTGTFGTGVPATGGETHASTSKVTTNR